MLTLALSKGRIFDDTLPLLERAGIRVAGDPESTRKLILPTNRADLRVVLVRASDVPSYVRYGGADFGVAGLDVEGLAGQDIMRPVGCVDTQLAGDHITPVRALTAATGQPLQEGARIGARRQPVEGDGHVTGFCRAYLRLFRLEHHWQIVRSEDLHRLLPSESSLTGG